MSMLDLQHRFGNQAVNGLIGRIGPNGRPSGPIEAAEAKETQGSVVVHGTAGAFTAQRLSPGSERMPPGTKPADGAPATSRHEHPVTEGEGETQPAGIEGSPVEPRLVQ